jgi:hypothetical protein
MQERKYEYIYKARKALGRPLPKGTQVHHVCDTLVICPSQAYHRLLHAREKALLACGDPTKRKCSICKTYDSVKNLTVVFKDTHTEGQYKHKLCATRYMQEYRKRRNNKPEDTE